MSADPLRFTLPGMRRRALLLGLLSLAAMAPCASFAASTPAPDSAASQTIVVFGDSQAEGLAAGLRRAVRDKPGLKVQNRTKPGTAISQPENYDWVGAIQDYVPDPPVTTAVVMFGGNDRLPMRPPNGAAIPFRSAAWHDIYRARVADIVHSLAGKNLKIVWVSDPICREARYSQDMDYLNGIYKDVLSDTAATWLDIWTVVASADGQYAAYGQTLDGATARLRLDDGIHFTPAGYDILASRVIKAISDTKDAAK